MKRLGFAQLQLSTKIQMKIQENEGRRSETQSKKKKIIEGLKFPIQKGKCVDVISGNEILKENKSLKLKLEEEGSKNIQKIRNSLKNQMLISKENIKNSRLPKMSKKDMDWQDRDM